MSKKRTLVVGDIHSGVRALEQLLLRAKVSVEDQLIFLGDYVDGWSTAVETIDFLLKLNETQRCIFIRGNHDELCYDWLTKGKDNPMWHKHGGGATKTSYSKASRETVTEHLKFYKNLKNYYVDQSNRLFLHAGFTNLKGVEYEYFKKTFYWDRTLWEMVKSLNPELTPDDSRYPKRLKHYKEIYIGHTPISKTEAEIVPGNEANVWNLDTGAAFKGPLSMMDIDTKEVWQSDTVQCLYPDELGRN
jgi:serine/threonine protein phosphatase 1